MSIIKTKQIGMSMFLIISTILISSTVFGACEGQLADTDNRRAMAQAAAMSRLTDTLSGVDPSLIEAFSLSITTESTTCTSLNGQASALQEWLDYFESSYTIPFNLGPGAGGRVTTNDPEASTTTTITTTTTTLPQNSCLSTNQDTNIYSAGYVTGTQNSVEYEHHDTCSNSNQLIQYYCSGDYYQEEYIICDTGCTTDRCNSPGSDSCTDSDEANDAYAFGSVSVYSGGNSQSYVDTCFDNTQVTQFECDGTTVQDLGETTCPYGCQDGACVYLNACSDTDNGETFKTQGTVTETVFNAPTQFTDSCVGNLLTEHYCDGIYHTQRTIYCDCMNGECEQSDFCSDTDGLNYANQGTIHWYHYDVSTQNEYYIEATDKCGTYNGELELASGQNLVEFKCNANTATYEDHNCAACSNGHCI